MSSNQIKKIQLLLMMVGAFLGMWGATQHLALTFNYSSVLDGALLVFDGHTIYYPWQILSWHNKFSEAMPKQFEASMLGILAGFVAGILGGAVVKKKFKEKEKPTYHGSARFATKGELDALRLAEKPEEARGVVLGREPGGKRLLTHKGKEHVFVFAPTRSGKGVGLVIPTLLTWRGSVFVLDIKGENWELTSGWRSQFSHAIYFNPTSLKSAVYNPLLEVGKGDDEVRDVGNIVSILADPTGDSKDDFWSNSAKAFLTGAILHVLYAEEDKSLAGVNAFLRSAEWTHEERLNRMLETPHLGRRGVHPVVARAAKSMLNMPDNTRGGVMATVESYLGLFEDPVVAAATSGKSEFRLRDLQYAPNPLSLYLVIPPSDLIRLRPLLRLMLTQMGGVLTQSLNADAINKHKLLLLLDEFPVLGRMDWFEAALAYIAGFDIKAMLIAQDLNQIEKAYGANNAILGNCHVRIAFAPNDERTAKRLAEMLGEATEVKATKSKSKKSDEMFGGGSITEGQSEFARALMTPGEILQMPPEKELIFIAGQPPVLADKVRYYEDKHFQNRSPGIGNGDGAWNAKFKAPTLTGRKPYHDLPPAIENPWTQIVDLEAIPEIPAELLVPVEEQDGVQLVESIPEEVERVEGEKDASTSDSEESLQAVEEQDDLPDISISDDDLTADDEEFIDDYIADYI